MLGLLGIGVALILGIGMRFAAVAGAALYLMMYAASLPLENNPVVDDHLLGADQRRGPGPHPRRRHLGLRQAQWAKTTLVQRFPVLR